jgi:hypothetical protein
MYSLSLMEESHNSVKQLSKRDFQGIHSIFWQLKVKDKFENDFWSQNEMFGSTRFWLSKGVRTMELEILICYKWNQIVVHTDWKSTENLLILSKLNKPDCSMCFFLTMSQIILVVKIRNKKSVWIIFVFFWTQIWNPIDMQSNFQVLFFVHNVFMIFCKKKLHRFAKHFLWIFCFSFYCTSLFF